MKQKVCIDSCNKLSIRDYIVSVLRPVNYQDEDYRDFLEALSIATDGAFYYTELGGQAISVISPLRTAEKVFSKNGRVIDRTCLRTIKNKIACLALSGVTLKPIISDTDGLLEFTKKDSDYELWMKFEQSQQHQEAVCKLAQILIAMANQAGREIHQDDMALLEQDSGTLALKIGRLAGAEIDDFMKKDIDDAMGSHDINPFDILTETYAYKVEKSNLVESNLQTYFQNSQGISFSPLEIDLTKRNIKRS